MLRNQDMKSGRILKLQYGRKKLAFILKGLKAGGVIMISTYTRHVQYDKRHLDAFKLAKDGSVLVRRGKHWDDIMGARVTFYETTQIPKKTKKKTQIHD